MAKPIVPALSEAEFQTAAVGAAQSFGWRCAHFRTSMSADGSHMTAVAYNGKGFPDCVFIHPAHRVLLVVEFKSMKGRMSSEQLMWADLFECVEYVAAPNVKYMIWRPDMMDQIVEYLEDPLQESETA